MLRCHNIQSFVRETIISFRGCLPLAVVIGRIPGFLLFFLRFAGTLPIIEMSTATLGWSCCAESDAWGNVRLYFDQIIGVPQRSPWLDSGEGGDFASWIAP